MTKKLFVVLVLITAMLVSFSLVMAAKKAPRGLPQPYVKHTIGQLQTATPMPRGSITATLEATNLYPDRGTKAAAATAEATASSGRIEAGPLVYTKDFCDLYGVVAYAITDWFWGMEWYANFQNPEEFGCVDVWPFEVIEVGFNIQVEAAIDIDVQGFVYTNAGDPACPIPGTEVCATPIYTVSIPSDGHWILSLPMTEQCCVYEPYFAVIYIYTDLYGSGADAIAEDDPTDLCRSYNDYGAGWEDLVVDYSWPGEMLLWSTGYTNPQNDCEEPADECRLQHDNGSASSYFGDLNVGDHMATYFDPAVDCVCDPVYPLHITEVEGAFYDFADAGYVDVIIHFYEAGDPCNGPGAEIYSFATTITTFYGDLAVVPLPEMLCIEEDFFLAVEYMSGITGEIPSLLFDNNAPVDTCIQWMEYLDYGWIEWWDFWQTPAGVGWLMLRAVGTCAAEECYPGEECYMSQDQGNIAWFNSGFEEGDQVVKYYNPEDYCVSPVYPYNIHDLDFLFYEVAGAGSVPVVIHVYLECQDSCDGPGTEIFVSEPFVPDLYSTMAHVEFDEPICVYEPFYIGWEYMAGLPGATPSPLFMDGTVEPAEYCHAWFYKVSAGFWIEHYDFWNDPAGVGYPLIRVSGYTEAPDCDIPQCDTTLETLGGSPTVAYYFKQPTNEQFMNLKYEMPSDHSGRLEGFQVAFYDYATTGSYGTPDPDLYVWLSDGTFPLDNNPPFQAIAEFHKTFGEIVWFPGYTYFDAYEYNLVFDAGELFHIGGGHAHEAGDTLAWLGDAATAGRASSWDGAAWGDFGAYLFVLDAIICPFAPENPTFSIRCTPSTGFATPGDPPVDVFQVEIGAVLGYAQNVTLSLLDPGVDITATFNPNGVPPEFDADVAIAVGGSVSYGDYSLTFQGVGDDQQTKTCGVTLRVQPPYDEGLVHFFHGTQVVSNFGAIANDASSDNFNWYGTNALYDGSIISAVPGDPQNDHMALDMYDCEHVGFIPNRHMTITDIGGCVGDPTYEELYGEMSYSEFYTSEDVISCEWDSLFIIGLRDVECTDFSIKIKIYYNPTETPIPELWAAVFEDWDVGDAYSNTGEMDPDHNLMYQWDPAEPSIVFGIMKVPFDDLPMQSMVFVYNPEEVYPTGQFSLNCGGVPGPSYMFDEFMVPGLFRNVGEHPWGQDPDDHSTFMASQPFSLNPDEKHIEIWIDFGRNTNDGMTWEQWYKKILRYVGMYRGDVNASDTLDLPSLDVSDLVYLINYLYKGGPAPLPFADQGNVDGKGPYAAFVGDNLDYLCPKNNVDVQDLVYLLNFIYKGGPPPVDYVRYIEQFWSRPSLFLNPLWN